MARVLILFRLTEIPGKANGIAALRYYRGTVCLTSVRYLNGLKLYNSCDSDWASDIEDRGTKTGCAFMMQKDGSANKWISKKQKTPGTSSSEAEYQAVASAVHDVHYQQSLLL